MREDEIKAEVERKARLEEIEKMKAKKKAKKMKMEIEKNVRLEKKENVRKKMGDVTLADSLFERKSRSMGRKQNSKRKRK